MSSYPEHLRHFDYVGPHRYFLTFCTHDRRRYFHDGAKVALVLDQFSKVAAREGFAIIAYCMMPDHAHLLVEGTTQEADLKRFVKAAKQYSGFHFKQRTNETLWQRYGYEHVLRNEETTLVIAGYIIANPVRAGLVASPTEYPSWGSFKYSREELLEYVQRAA